MTLTCSALSECFCINSDLLFISSEHLQVLILLDFSETFDTMENSLLSETLISLGFCSPTHPLLLFLLLWQLLLLCVFQLFLTWKSESEAAQSCPTLCDPMDCSLPCSSVQEIFQARVMEWVAISFSRGPSQPRYQTWVSCIAGRCFTIWATREVLTYLPFKDWSFPGLILGCLYSLCFSAGYFIFIRL